MNSVLVCGKWELRLRHGAGGYYHYINERRNEVGRNACCIRWLLEEVDEDIRVAYEPFGGVGVFATVIQGVCKPDGHYLYDIDEDCLDQLAMAFRGNPTVTVRKGDALETIGAIDADLCVLDFPSPYTRTHHDKWAPQWKQLLNRPPRSPKLVIWMDGASFGMQWHKEHYARLFDQPIGGNEDYAKATSVFMHKIYGYSLRAATVSQGCFYFAATPGPVTDFELRRFTTKGCALVPA